MATNQTVCRLLVGNELRRIREERGLKQEDAAEHIGAKLSKISRLELGQTRVSVAEIKMLLEFYEDDPSHIQGMLDLARNANQRGRWEGDRAAFPEWFRMFVDLESDAEQILQVQAEIVPGILQIEPYIRAIHEGPTGRPAVQTDVDAHVRSRQERQRIFTRGNPPSLSFVLSESCLHRQVGGPETMKAQLDYLIEVAELPTAQIQVLPFKTKTYAATVSYAFTMLTLGAPGIASPLEIVYVESYDRGFYLDDKEAVRRYGDLWRHMTAAALGPAESLALLRDAAKLYP